MKQRRIGIITALIFFTMFLFVGGLLVNVYQKEVRSMTETAKGVIIDFRTYGSGSKRKYTPIVEYEIAGKGTVGRSGKTVNKPLRNLDIGDEVTVFYNPQNVSRVRIKGYDNAMGLVLGVVAMILGILIPFGIIKGTWNN